MDTDPSASLSSNLASGYNVIPETTAPDSLPSLLNVTYRRWELAVLGCTVYNLGTKTICVSVALIYVDSSSAHRLRRRRAASTKRTRKSSIERGTTWINDATCDMYTVEMEALAKFMHQ
ncbi:hypothetical protein DPMN_173480 [Dreissena polymorpha]|uniref:Uncharacterized protein n=1 Tax=Dreissena polymorpha TaxID=45954 RepID=A0A9D4IG46_DREPO|nr:hypothetical protein DPMN_173480 [Dreissena polymorpha]